jgi:hypothetical protein
MRTICRDREAIRGHGKRIPMKLNHAEGMKYPLDGAEIDIKAALRHPLSEEPQRGDGSAVKIAPAYFSCAGR